MTISIITVVFNSISNIKSTVDSVKKQSFKDIEYVIIDGNSTDGTKEYIEDNRSLFSYVVSERDEGLYYAMNKGIDAASGDFVLFMNAGDIFVDDFVIEKMTSEITDTNKLYFGNTLVFFDKVCSKAPKLHHQSILFPKIFYAKNYYKADIFKVSAEGDYIYRATQAVSERHIDVNIIYSKLEGFRVTRFKTINGIKLMLSEYKRFYTENALVLKNSALVKYLLTSIVKYCSFKLGGMPLVAKVLLYSYK